jgi:hypothetical protein
MGGGSRLPTCRISAKCVKSTIWPRKPYPHPMAKDGTKPAAMAITKGGFFKEKVEQGRYGPIFPKTPASYGFSVIAKVIPGREEHIYNHAKVMEKAIADDPDTLAILKAHYLRWLIFTIKGENYLIYQAIFDSDFDKYCEDASFFFGQTGIQSAFEHAYVSCEEIKKALRLKAAFSTALDPDAVTKGTSCLNTKHPEHPGVRASTNGMRHVQH